MERNAHPYYDYDGCSDSEGSNSNKSVEVQYDEMKRGVIKNERATKIQYQSIRKIERETQIDFIANAHANAKDWSFFPSPNPNNAQVPAR